MIGLSGPYTFKDVVRTMGNNSAIDWEVRYYAYGSTDWDDFGTYMTSFHRWISKACSDFPNIKLVAEVYGNLVWELEGTTPTVTRNITPSSKLWPSWPDDVPCRRFERVLSDEAISEDEV